MSQPQQYEADSTGLVSLGGKATKPKSGLEVKQAFLINASTLPGLCVGQTNLVDSNFKGKNLKMVLVDGGLAVSGTDADKKTTLKFFIPNSNIKACALV